MQTPLDPVTLSHLRIRTTANAPGQTPESYGIAWDMVNTEQTVAISNRLNSPQSVLGRCINTPSPSSGRPPQAGRLQSNNSRCVMSVSPPTHTHSVNQGFLDRHWEGNVGKGLAETRNHSAGRSLKE